MHSERLGMEHDADDTEGPMTYLIRTTTRGFVVTARVQGEQAMREKHSEHVLAYEHLGGVTVVYREERK